MNKKIIAIALIVIFIIIISIFVNKKSNNTNNDDNVLDSSSLNIVYQNDRYVIEGATEEDVKLEFNTEDEAIWYQTHPDYNPEPVHIDGEDSSENNENGLEGVLE